jgi:hypothetical protein
MKPFVTLFVLFSFASVWSQKHYLVEYDRITNTEKYFELTYDHGAFSESEIKKPVIKKGDVVKIRSVNVNPLVFQMNIKDPQQAGVKSPGAKSLAGFSDVLSELNGVSREIGSQFNALSWNRPEVPNFNRGEAQTAEQQKRNESLQRLESFHAVLTETYTVAQKYKTSAEAILSTSLSKTQILQLIDSMSASAEIETYKKNRAYLDVELQKITDDPILNLSDYENLERSYTFLKNELDSSVLSPLQFRVINEEFRAAEFTKEYSTVLGYDPSPWASEKFDLQNNVSSVDYCVEFLDAYSEIPEESARYKDGLLQSHTIHLAVQAPSGFSWSTGFMNVITPKGFTNYTLKETSFGDSVQITTDGQSVKSRFTLATNLNYNFASARNLIPQLNFGMAIGFAGDEKPLNILIGGGLKFRQFPFVGISAGLAFCQNNALNSGYTLNDTYENVNTENLSNQFTKKIYSPGYYFGLNITL